MPYKYQATVAIPAASGSTLINFTAVLTGTNTVLKTVANGGQVQNTVTRVGQTVPADLILSSDAQGLNLYKWGWDFYDAINGIVIIWILIPSFSNSVATTIYISVGNVSVTTYQGGSQGQEFDTSTLAVWHFPNGTTLNPLDFSSHSNNLTNSSTTSQAGKIDGDAFFNLAIPSHLDTFSFSDFNFSNTTPFSIGLWVNYLGINAGATNTLIGRLDTANNFKGWELCSQASNSGSFFQIFLISTFPSNAIQQEINFSPSLNTWYHVFFTYDGTSLASGVKGYVNGVLQTNRTPLNNSLTLPITNSVNPRLGLRINGSSNYSGSQDELKVFNLVKNANWIASEYSNQNTIPIIGTFTLIPLGGGGNLLLLGVQ